MVSVVVVFVWRDIWVLFDELLFPDELELSTNVSIVSLQIYSFVKYFIESFKAVGFTLSLVCFAMEPLVSCLCRKFEEQKNFIFNIFLVFCLVGSITVWRGLWNFMDIKTGKTKKIF